MTSDEHALAPLDAARALREAARYDLSLRQRMEGVLWIVLGLTLASLFFSYAFAVAEDVPVGLLAFLWLPWTLAGLAIVRSLRASLVLAGPSADEGAPWTLLLVGVAAAGLLGVAALLVVGVEAAPGTALLAVGVLALVPALAPRMGFTALGRRVGMAIGAFGILAALGVLAAGGGGNAGTWAAGAVCLAWIAGGTYQSLQG